MVGKALWLVQILTHVVKRCSCLSLFGMTGAAQQNTDTVANLVVVAGALIVGEDYLSGTAIIAVLDINLVFDRQIFTYQDRLISLAKDTTLTVAATIDDKHQARQKRRTTGIRTKAS
jgi:hypothetical protein